jgi:hypothetical protein
MAESERHNLDTGIPISTEESGGRQLKSFLTTKYGDRLKEIDKNNDGQVDRR